MDLGLEGKVAWVLGASSGLGRASAEALVGEGAKVAASARGADRLAQAADEIARAASSTCIPVPVDVTDGPGVTKAHEEVVGALGPVDVLVVNAGGPPQGTFVDVDDDALRAAFELTTESAWRVTSCVLPSMRERGGGCVLYVTSWSTKEVIPNLILSNMMRAAVVGMAKTLSKEVGADGVRVCCVAPGRIETPRLLALDRRTAETAGIDEDEVRNRSQEQIALRRYGTPREFGDTVAFLASERASYISGITVVVDGGFLDGILS